MRIESLVPIVVTVGAIYGVVRWVRAGKVTAEPWGAEIDAAVHQADAVPVCHRCLTPQTHEDWLCANCGAAAGQYTNYLPFVLLFSEGEMFRAGVTERLRPSALIGIGYFLLSVSFYAIFAPLYWYFLIKNLSRFARDRNLDDETGAPEAV